MRLSAVSERIPNQKTRTIFHGQSIRLTYRSKTPSGVPVDFTGTSMIAAVSDVDGGDPIVELDLERNDAAGEVILILEQSAIADLDPGDYLFDFVTTDTQDTSVVRLREIWKVYGGASV